MFRTAATRNLPRKLQAINTPASRNAFTQTILRSAFRTSSRQIRPSPALALAVRNPTQIALVRYAHNVPDPTGSKKEEEKWAHEKLQPEPDVVSLESSVHNVSGETATAQPEQDVDMAAGIRSDFVCESL